MVDHVMLEGLVLLASLSHSRFVFLCRGSKKCPRLRPDRELCLVALIHLSFGLGSCSDGASTRCRRLAPLHFGLGSCEDPREATTARPQEGAEPWEQRRKREGETERERERERA